MNPIEHGDFPASYVIVYQGASFFFFNLHGMKFLFLFMAKSFIIKPPT